MNEENPRSGRCALVGRPNVGKSTLLNALIGQKLAITASKPETTRSALVAVMHQAEPPTQIAFVDTPGIHRPKNVVGRMLVEEAKSVLTGVDVVVLLADAPAMLREQTPLSKDQDVLSAIVETKLPTILALNKVDMLKQKTQLLPLLQNIDRQKIFQALVPISAKAKTNLNGLVREIREHLPEGLMYEADMLTDRPLRYFASELVRESVIAHTRAEIPHGVVVLIEAFEEKPKRTDIQATIVVDKDSHKGIVIGAKGQMLKAIGMDARKAIEALVEQPVVLKLWVKVDAGWTSDPHRVRRLMAEASS